MPVCANDQPTPYDAANFRTTHWSVVLNARDGAPKLGEEALEQLCRTYWYPLYAFIRRKGYSAEDAQDLVQGFFEQFLSKRYLDSVGREKGRFRTFLLTSAAHYLANEHDYRTRQKRGGGAFVLSLDHQAAEERYQNEAATDLPPDKLFERRWAERVVQLVLERLREEFKTAGEEERFDALKPFLMGERQVGQIAQKFNLTEAGARSAVGRLRQRFGQLLRNEIGQTVSTPADVDEELRHLLAALSD